MVGISVDLHEVSGTYLCKYIPPGVTQYLSEPIWCGSSLATLVVDRMELNTTYRVPESVQEATSLVVKTVH